MKRCDLTKGLVFFLTIIITVCCGLIASSWAFDDAGNCTNKSLKGYYGFSESGEMKVLTEVKSYASIGFFCANGKGNIYGEETLQLGYDETIEAVFEGTYKIYENCMGKAYITASTELGDINMEISLVISGSGGNDVHMLNSHVDFFGMMHPSGIVGMATRLTDD